jgi:hypothetical protein
MGRKRALIARGGVITLTIVGAIACVALGNPVGTMLFLAYAGAGAYLVIRRPNNRVGWLLLAIGCGLALGSVRVPVGLGELLSGDLDPFQATLTWAYGWGWSLVMIGFLGITLVFPDGQLPQQRGRRASRAALGGIAALAVSMAVGPTLLVLPAGSASEVTVPNPLALPGAPLGALLSPGALFTLMLAIVLTGLVAMFARFRRSAGLERLQYRWLAAAIVVVASGTFIWMAATVVFELDDHSLPAVAIVVLTYPAIPIAVAVAVLRFRLYEIDRIVSRTIAYAAVTSVLVAVFAGAVIVLQAVLARVTQGETLAVVASTLLAFALVQPLRGRVQSAIDRRFDRSRYDGERTSAAFSARLRDEMDLPTVTADLDATVRQVMTPTRMEIWLRDESR